MKTSGRGFAKKQVRLNLLQRLYQADQAAHAVQKGSSAIKVFEISDLSGGASIGNQDTLQSQSQSRDTSPGNCTNRSLESSNYLTLLLCQYPFQSSMLATQ